jgi:hypothetical protein
MSCCDDILMCWCEPVCLSMLVDGRKEGSEGRMVSEVKEPRQSSYATLDMTLNGRLEKMPLHPMA